MGQKMDEETASKKPVKNMEIMEKLKNLSSKHSSKMDLGKRTLSKQT